MRTLLCRLSSAIFLVLFGMLPLVSQNTIGVIQSHPGSLEGYTFFSPFSSTKAFMVDNCGRLINEWDRGTRPGLAAYFLENGLMLRTFKPSPQGPFTSASNAGGIEFVDWDNNTVWSYQINSATELSHHDATYLPNGNVLLLTWELVYTDELISLGRDPGQIAPQGFMWSEHIVEVEPVGSDSAAIVWEWRIKDHYIQDFDETKAGFGVIAEHPELFNINLPEINSSNSNASRDWNHFNAIDYHPGLDQILISTRNSDEIWILDHSTTTEEAASHSGGRYDKGGDILYRWGNASAYDRASLNEQKLFGQHGVQWIDDGLEDAGKIIIFNNGNGRPGPDFSLVEILAPPQDTSGGYLISKTDPFGPEQSQWSYGDQSGEGFYSSFLSNAQRLANGNTLINAGSPGTVFEINSDREIVWEYVIPLSGDFPGIQGQNISNNATFRAYKFAPDYPGLTGKELTPGTTIESGTNPEECMLSTRLALPVTLEVQVIYHRTDHTLQILHEIGTSCEAVVFDMMGKQIASGLTNEGVLQLPQLPSGAYVVNGWTNEKQRFVARVLIY